MTDTSTARPMAARFASTCGACGAAITKGSPILYTPGMVANHNVCGDPTEPQPARSSRGRSTRRPIYSGARYTGGRCTHEDYPCCGCDQ